MDRAIGDYRSRSEFLAGPAGYGEELLIADCDLADARRKQWDGTSNDALADRRPELYSSVVAPLVTRPGFPEATAVSTGLADLQF